VTVTVTVRGRGTEQNAWEEHVLVGALIMESLRAGFILDAPGLVVRKLSRVSPAHVSDEQPAVWTLLEFDSDTAEPDLLAEQLSHALDSPGWYANLYSDGQIYVIFPHRVFSVRPRGRRPARPGVWRTRSPLGSQPSSATGDSDLPTRRRRPQDCRAVGVSVSAFSPIVAASRDHDSPTCSPGVVTRPPPHRTRSGQ